MTKKNIIFSTITFFLKFLNNFLLFAILSHHFSVETFGFIGYAISVALIFTHIVDYGYRLKIVKDISSSHSVDLNVYLSKIIITKVFISITVFIAIAYFWISSDYSIDKNIFMTLLLLSAILMSFFNFNAGLFQGKNLFHLESNLYASYTAIIFTSLIIAIYMHLILPIAIGFFLGALVIFSISYIKIQELITFKFDYKLDWIKELLCELQEVFPYAIHVVISTLLINLEIVFVEHFCDAYSLGIYQAYIKIIVGLTIVSTIFSSALLPIISKQMKEKNMKLLEKNLFLYKTSLFLIMGILLSIYFIFDDTLIGYVFGKQYVQIEQFKIFIVFIVACKYISIIPGIILTTSDNQILRVKILAVVLFLTMFAFMIFLPLYGFRWAFYISTISNFVISISYFMMSRKILTLERIKNG